jgi:hypothetical protein
MYYNLRPVVEYVIFCYDVTKVTARMTGKSEIVLKTLLFKSVKKYNIQLR